MSDREARALGAGATIEVDGTEYTLSPVKLQQLAELQRAALAYYRNSFLSTYRDNLDLLPEGFLEKKLEEAARWDVTDLPGKKSYSADYVPITDQLREKLQTVYAEVGNLDDAQFRNLLVAALDSEQISPQEVKELSGMFPQEITTPYDLWWVTGCYDGIIRYIYESIRLRHPRIKLADVAKWTMTDQLRAMSVVNEITTPAVGNT